MLKSLLTFDKMVAPRIITVLYWLGLIGILFSGIVAIVLLVQSGSFLGVLGLVSVVIGLLSMRIFCELIILLFNIYEKLEEIAENTKMK